MTVDNHVRENLDDHLYILLVALKSSIFVFRPDVVCVFIEFRPSQNTHLDTPLTPITQTLTSKELRHLGGHLNLLPFFF